MDSEAARDAQGDGRGSARGWNVVVTAYREGGRWTLRALRRLGPAEPSGHYNVFLATADDPMALLASLEARASKEPVLIDSISRIAPAQACFDYEGDRDFEGQVLAIAAPWLERLGGKSFHVRLHRRGDGLACATQDEEARVGGLLLQELEKQGLSARIEFNDPDLVLSIDAVDGRAGVALWSRDDLCAHRFLRPD